MKELLIKFLNDTKLIESANTSFWKSLHKYKIEEEGEYLSIINNKEVNIELNSISYKMFMDDYNQDVIIIKYDIYREKSIVGYYSFIVDYISKVPIDDYLVFR